MDIKEYQEEAKKTAIYPKIDGKGWLYPALGLPNEAGEVAGKIKKIVRDHSFEMTEEMRLEIGKEIGDVLWYTAQLASELNLSLDEIAQKNLNKLKDRQERGVLKGNGDNR